MLWLLCVKTARLARIELKEYTIYEYLHLFTFYLFFHNIQLFWLYAVYVGKQMKKTVNRLGDQNVITQMFFSRLFDTVQLLCRSTFNTSNALQICKWN